MTAADEIKNELLSDLEYSDRLNFLSHICDIFDSYSDAYGDLTEVIQLLVNLSSEENHVELKEEYINTIQTAAGNRDIYSINFDSLLNDFEALNDRMKLDVIDILGYTYNDKYIEFLNAQLASKNDAISSTAAMSLDELKAGLDNNRSIN